MGNSNINSIWGGGESKIPPPNETFCNIFFLYALYNLITLILRHSVNILACTIKLPKYVFFLNFNQKKSVQNRFKVPPKACFRTLKMLKRL